MQRYQDIIQTEREQTNTQKTQLMKDIESLNEKIIAINDNLTAIELEKQQYKIKYELELKKNENLLQKTNAIHDINTNNNAKMLNKTDTENIENMDNVNDMNDTMTTNEITDETIEEMYQQQQTQQEFTLTNGGNSHELLMATSVREKHELEIIKTIPVGGRDHHMNNVLQMELNRAKEQLQYYEQKANTDSNETQLLRNR